MRRGSVVGLKHEKYTPTNDKASRKSLNSSRLSYQFKNLTRGASFAEAKFMKWVNEMDDETLHIVESVTFADIKKLGHEIHLVKEMEDRMDFTDEVEQEFNRINQEFIDKMYYDLAIENPDDLNRRKVQETADTSFNYDTTFIGQEITSEFYC